VTGRQAGPPAADWTPEQVAAMSAAEIAAGRLPLSAQRRISAQRAAAEQGYAAFTSALSVEEFAALRTIGFAPVGQVMGSAVYNIGWSYTGCGYQGGRGLFRGYAPSYVVDVPATRQLIEEARHRALHRLRQECVGLGGDGVVGVQLTVGSFYGNGLEFMAVGTAVRAEGDTRPPRPFTSDLTGQEFVKLIRAGWLPVALAMGVGVAMRHDDWLQLRQQSSWQNQELVGATQLVHAARASARSSLDADVRRHGGRGVVLRDMTLRVAEVSCRRGGDDAHDHFADAFLFGTAIVPLPERDTDPATRQPPLPMLRLG
jgi:uncharacterized protein YbjQ (UPF0145 family)